MAACQALDLKPENHELGKGTKPAYDMIRSKVAFIEFDKDIEIFEELNKASAVVESEEFLATIEKAVDLSIQYWYSKNKAKQRLAIFSASACFQKNKGGDKLAHKLLSNDLQLLPR